MKLSNIEINNFRQYYNSVNIDLTTNYDQNIIIIGGRNGYGKTNLLLSIVWCLYGEKISQVDDNFKKEIQKEKNYSSFMQQSINWTAKKENTDTFSISIVVSEIELPDLNKLNSNSESVIITRTFNVTSMNEKLSILDPISNIEIFDSTQNVILKGNYGDYYEKQKKGLITGRVLFIQISDGDSLFLHADTLKSEYDSSGTYQILRAYNKVQAYKSDLQLRSDSLVFNFKDSIIQVLKNPILWTDNNQITGEKIIFHLADNKVDFFELINSSLIISQEDSTHFSQIKGVNMKGYFNKNSQLYFVNVNNKSEAIYFPKEKGEIIGVNKSKCKNMNIYLDKGEVEKVVFLKKPTQTLYPLDKMKDNKLKFSNFKWLEKIRPLSKSDVFIW
jgi:DNA sulfur modification protein DndD